MTTISDYYCFPPLLPLLPVSSYTPQDVYKVVADVNSYKQFLPWCKDSLYLRETEQKSMVRLVVGFPPLLETYTALLLTDPPNLLRVSISVVDDLQYLLLSFKVSPPSSLRLSQQMADSSLTWRTHGSSEEDLTQTQDQLVSSTSG